MLKTKQIRETVARACALDPTLSRRLRAHLWFEPRWSRMGPVEFTALHLAYQIETDPVVAVLSERALAHLSALYWWRSVPITEPQELP